MDHRDGRIIFSQNSSLEKHFRKNCRHLLKRLALILGEIRNFDYEKKEIQNNDPDEKK